jgi:hypothetical protein
MSGRWQLILPIDWPDREELRILGRLFSDSTGGSVGSTR